MVRAVLMGHMFAAVCLWAEGPVEVSLCEVVRNPERYYSQLLKVRAAIYPHGVDEPRMIWDESCKKGLPVRDFNKSFDMSTRVAQELVFNVGQRRICEATYTGMVHRNLARGGESHVSFTIHSVEDLTVRPRESRKR